MKTIKYILLFILLIVTNQIVSAQAVYYVDGSHSSSGNGSSWSQAFKTVQEGINAASGSLSSPASQTAEVWVKEGTYYIYSNSAENTVNMAEGVMIYGGFDGTETKRDDRDWKKNVTILDGHQYAGSSTQVKHVVTAFGENQNGSYYAWSNGLIDGFTITGGKISAGNPGLKSANTVTSITATDPTSILSNANEMSGAGILIFKCGPNVSNCTITGNAAGKGAGMYIVTSTQWPPAGSNPIPEIYNCTISNNSATVRGGGIALDVHSEPHFINCKIQNNSCDAKGGGAYIDWGCPEPVFINCLFTGNSAARAGALGADGSSSPKLINCTIVNNHTEDVGAGLYTGSYNPDHSSSNEPILINCIVWGNTSDWGGPTDLRIWGEDYYWVSHSLLGEGFTSYGNSVLYTNPSLADISGNNYKLSSNSPCINAGTTSDSLDVDNDIPDFDIDGNTRDGSPDMGCYEYSGCVSYTDTVSHSICDGDNYFTGGAWQTTPGFYTDTLTTAGGCDSIIVTNLTVEDMSTPEISQKGDTLFSDKPNGNQWFLNDKAIDGANQNYYICTENGNYYAVLTSQQGCMSEPSNTIQITLTGIEAFNEYNLKVYPNPTNEKIYIEGIKDIGEKITIRVFDANGRTVYSTKVAENCTIDVSTFKPGVYILDFSNSTIKYSTSIIKK